MTTPNQTPPACFWMYDANFRVYRDPETGIKEMSPIYRLSWVRHEIIGETKQSWLYGEVSRPMKLAKKEPRHDVVFSLDEVEQRCYVHHNRYRLAALVKSAEYEQLKEIERILS